jgi:hypothetical protein
VHILLTITPCFSFSFSPQHPASPSLSPLKFVTKVVCGQPLTNYVLLSFIHSFYSLCHSSLALDIAMCDANFIFYYPSTLAVSAIKIAFMFNKMSATTSVPAEGKGSTANGYTHTTGGSSRVIFKYHNFDQWATAMMAQIKCIDFFSDDVRCVLSSRFVIRTDFCQHPLVLRLTLTLFILCCFCRRCTVQLRETVLHHSPWLAERRQLCNSPTTVLG